MRSRILCSLLALLCLTGLLSLVAGCGPKEEKDSGDYYTGKFNRPGGTSAGAKAGKLGGG